jgi:uncharacterized protein
MADATNKNTDIYMNEGTITGMNGTCSIDTDKPLRLEDDTGHRPIPSSRLATLDELLERDRQREADGFPRKIRVGKMIRQGKDDSGAIVIVPTTTEEKLMHDSISEEYQEGESGGTGEGEEGEVIGEQPVRPQQGGDGTGAGQGDNAGHEIESNAYDLGKLLTEKFELPNIRDKGGKRSLTRYIYDITDKNRGFGHVIDKKATLRQILKTNFALGRITSVDTIDPVDLLVSPADRIYRILSREKEYESQALVFFIRDYSGSMMGKCTELIASQHVFIYSWLLYQYKKRVETRFILHDTEAKEVPDFYTYFNLQVAGGTQVASAYRLVNELIEKEELHRDYNIYVFQGTDGDDWDTKGKETIPELKRLLEYSARIGITIAEHNYSSGSKTEVQEYLEGSGLLVSQADKLRMDVIKESADEKRLIEGIRKLISQKVTT